MSHIIEKALLRRKRLMVRSLYLCKGGED